MFLSIHLYILSYFSNNLVTPVIVLQTPEVSKNKKKDYGYQLLRVASIINHLRC